MKIIVSSSYLLKQLQVLGNVINSSNTLPILDNFLFELNKLTEDYLIIEKSNFMHAGWFSFEVYEEKTLMGKNRFQITKDYKINGK